MSDRVADLDLVRLLGAVGVARGSPVAFAPAPGGGGIAAAGQSWPVRGDAGDVAAAVARVTGELAPRWVWWSSAAAAPLVAAQVRPSACWDLAAVHRLLHGGSRDSPAETWATVRGLPLDAIPVGGQLDLLATGPGAGQPSDDGGDPTRPVRPDGYLRLGWAEHGPTDPERAARWAELAMEVQEQQRRAVDALADRRADPTMPPPLPLLTAWAESAAELMAVELAACGLPLDRAEAARLIASHAGERPADDAAAAAIRRRRDDQVRSLVPGGDDVDLRNPAQVRAWLARIGIVVPDTRSWRLEPLRDTHPAVAALLQWRKSERIATTYGYAWLERHVGADGRLRGAWQGSDGAAGRMTAQAGLHNLPAELRAAVLAAPGHVFVRADLGQVEPRVLAAVSGDRALAAATVADDLYAPVASRLGCDRPVAKVAVLAAMYGQTSGAAGQALRGMDEAYPVAMAFLRSADEDGQAGRDVRTWGGRLVRMYPVPSGPEDAARAAISARGRFARNAVVQGAAAELFKMWAVTVRAGLAEHAAEIVLCLHDELLVHVPEESAPEVVDLLRRALSDTAARWAAGGAVRFVADVAVVRRWSDAK